AQPLGLVAGFTAPAMTVAYEESLVRSETLDRLQVLSLGVVFPRHVGEDQPAEVGDILPQGELTVDFDVINNRVRRILIGNTAGAPDELFAIFGGPPVAKITLGIELAAFVVEAVGELVAN